MRGQKEFRDHFPNVSHETLVLLERYVALLLKWQRSINLIGSSTQDDIWSRHIVDCYQVVATAPEARLWVDLGSGAGLPGLIIAAAMKPLVGVCHLVESNHKKAAFLNHAARELEIPAIVHTGRIEDVVSTLPLPEIVTARALASIDQLLLYSNLLLKRGAEALFLKGREVEAELTEARKNWQFDCDLLPSVTQTKAMLVRIRHVTPRD